MLQEILKKSVVISVGTTDFSYVIKGIVLEIADAWLKVETKKNIEYIKIDAVVKIVVNQA